MFPTVKTVSIILAHKWVGYYNYNWIDLNLLYADFHAIRNFPEDHCVYLF